MLGKLRALVPKELAARVKVHVAHGDIGHGIAAAAERLSAVCIVMGEHTRTAGAPVVWRQSPERRASRGALSGVVRAEHARCVDHSANPVLDIQRGVARTMNLRCSNVSGFSLTTVITICPKLLSASLQVKTLDTGTPS